MQKYGIFPTFANFRTIIVIFFRIRVQMPTIFRNFQLLFLFIFCKTSLFFLFVFVTHAIRCSMENFSLLEKDGIDIIPLYAIANI